MNAVNSGLDAQPHRAGNPYLAGNAAPIAEEVTAFDLAVRGSIPRELEGRWLRNGPNPRGEIANPMRHHWFLGTGMVHGVRLRDGKAEWYRNRFVGDGNDFSPNTSVAGFAGHTLAIVEGGPQPMALTYELDTIGPYDFNGTLPGPLTAHPKYDSATRELHAVGYHWPDLMDHLHYIVADSSGMVTKKVDIPVADMPMVHDMSLTERYAVIYDLPLTVNFDMLEQGYNLPFRWNPERQARVGLLPRDGTADDIVWCPCPQQWVFHPLNAYDAADGTVVIDLCAYDRMFDQDLLGPGDAPALLDRWIIDPAAQTVTSHTISDRPQEFPQLNPAFNLKRHRWSYTSETMFGTNDVHGATLKIDVETGAMVEHGYGPHRGGAEPIFVAREGSSAEDDGWLLVVVYDASTDSSELHILAADDLAAEAQAIIELPQRVPYGFHGSWVPDTRVNR